MIQLQEIALCVHLPSNSILQQIYANVEHHISTTKHLTYATVLQAILSIFKPLLQSVSLAILPTVFIVWMKANANNVDLVSLSALILHVYVLKEVLFIMVLVIPVILIIV